jgi:hypothetical protein
MLIKSHPWRDGIEATFSKGCFGKPALIVALGMLLMTSACVAARQVPRVESETLSPPAATETSLPSATFGPSIPTTSTIHETPSATLSEPEEHVTTSASNAWLLIASKHGYLRTLDLASGEFVAQFSNVIDWRHGAPIKLDERIGSQAWVALRKSYKLFIYGLVDEEPLHELQLFDGSKWMEEAGSNAYPYEQIYAIHGAWAPPIWSPTSPVLAYNAALEGKWVQVYTFDVEANTSIKVTPEGEHAVALSWSPDGRYLVYAIVSKFKRDGYIADEIGVMDFESGFEVMRVRKYSRNPLREIGWLSDNEMLVAEQLPLAGYMRLDLVDIESGTMRFLNDSTFFDADFSVQSRLVLTTENLHNGQGELVFIEIGEEDNRSTQYERLDVEVGAVQWIPGVDLFSVETQEGTLLIDEAGEIILTAEADGY